MSNTNEASNAVYQRMLNWALTVNAQNHFNDFKRSIWCILIKVNILYA